MGIFFSTMCLVAALRGGGSGAGLEEPVTLLMGAWPAFPLAAGALSPDEADWLVRGLVVAATVLGILVAIKVLRTPPAKVPLQVQGTVTYVEEPEFSKFSEYVHKKNHEIANQIQHLELAAEERRTEAGEQQAAVLKELAELGEKMDGKRSTSVARLHEQLKAAELKLAGVESDARTHTQQLAKIDEKLTNILQRLPRRAS